MLTRSQLARNQDIRGNVPKSLGDAIARAFGNTPLDLTSGDLPKCLNGRFFPLIDAAMKGMDPTHMAYDHPLYGIGQEHAWTYITGLRNATKSEQRARSHIIPGISGFMSDAVEITAQAAGFPKENWNSDGPIFVLIPPLHPHWITSVVGAFGYNSIRIIKRGTDGLPDMEDMERVFRTIDRPFVVIASPDENPTGVCTPNSILLNKERTGLIDLIRGGSSRWGMLLLDNIYMDLAWGENAGKRHELVQGIEESGVRALVMHSLSKVFMKPGVRVGGVCYVGPLDSTGMKLLTEFKAIVDGKIKNGVSATAINALIAAYSPDPSTARELSRVRGTVRARVEVNDRTMNRGAIEHAYPDAALESAFYGLHIIGRNVEGVPWKDPLYHQMLIDAVQRRFELTGAMDDLEIRLSWGNFREYIGVKGLSPSHAFAIELAMHGITVLPHDPFFPLFADDNLSTISPAVPVDEQGRPEIMFRTILAHPEEVIRIAAGKINDVWQAGVEVYRGGHWRTKYG